MSSDLNSILWPASRLGEALLALAGVENKKLPTLEWNPDWLESAARSLNLEAQPVEIPYPDFERHLSRLGPAILYLPAHDGDRFLVLARGLFALTPARERVRISPEAVRSALCAELEAPVLKEIQDMLHRAGIPAPKQTRAASAILRERFTTRRIRGIWILRLPPSATFWRQLRQARVPSRLAILGTAHALQYALWILAWWIVGRNVLNGQTDRSWLLPWALILLTLVPLRILITWMQGLLAFGAGARIKERLFFGALRADTGRARHSRRPDSPASKGAGLGRLRLEQVFDRAFRAVRPVSGLAPGHSRSIARGNHGDAPHCQLRLPANRVGGAGRYRPATGRRLCRRDLRGEVFVQPAHYSAAFD